MSARFVVATLGASLMALALPAAAQQKPAAPNTAMCAGCHGIPGYKTAFPTVYHVPKIAGQQPEYIANALRAYKTGERSHPSMQGVAKGLTEEEIKAYAEYYGGAGK